MNGEQAMRASAGERIELIAESYRRLTGRALAPAGEIWRAAAAVVAHDTGDPPRFFYANRQALELFAMQAEEFIGLPSYRSAEPGLREERAAMLARLSEREVIEDYSGVRIAADGRRFRIERATVWNLVDREGRRHGQAATFAGWTWL